ncbi:uroporphyrinogen-III C-methyltransferase [Ignicoccus hospitalis]|uniref:uroporphyrinogen-III C-methyltransferase n=1 Tax=Ignicoccus hospitalis (strain KIN4/I / DSM 18386 / JCM 14125) TaxID=453591 RepID=A8A8M1_IGNH4|nr:uroporphyrinogen-III C-methyltransferase [Ignicoccus hospitalis]ABU81273.1 uroporphyrin-III C-methyltransferase [Ignicoccus hospitalis KIN4/I]HIH90955.1 uroporphyrinogen-III C-methyltransferase [Desulfurococcaceae archaeon]
MKGKVYLVGAGPGGAWLAPAAAFGLLRSADVVLYDKLVDKSLLSSAFKAEKVYVGKAPGAHALSQEEINELLIKYAKEGKVVVRLKGGDPFVLGRGDEECEALRAAGVECEVVPAPTSATAVPACAGIPVTRRNLANTFAVATGWAAEGSERPRYGEILKVVDTLVVLMGVTKVNEIVSDILKVRDVPAAAVTNGCTEEQKVVVARASKLPEVMVRNGVKPPAVLVFGEVVEWACKAGTVRDVVECSL